jgi:hypothetical protein
VFAARYGLGFQIRQIQFRPNRVKKILLMKCVRLEGVICLTTKNDV